MDKQTIEYRRSDLKEAVSDPVWEDVLFYVLAGLVALFSFAGLTGFLSW